MPRLAEVILPLPLQRAFTYAVPPEMEADIRIGTRVLVPFGRRKMLTGIVESFPAAAPGDYDLKTIVSLLDTTPIVRHPQLKFWNWIADYYLCTPGEVMKAALPAALKVESETILTLPSADEADACDASYTEAEARILQYVDHNGKVKVSQLDTLDIGPSAVRNAVKSLLDSGRLRIHERVVDKYLSRKISCVRLCCPRDDNDRLHAIFDLVAKARKQEKLLIAFLELSGWMRRESEPAIVERQELLQKAQASPAILKALCDKGIFEIYRLTVNRFSSCGTSSCGDSAGTPSLSQLQAETMTKIETAWKDHAVTLLRGITGSGKTEIYANLIRKCLSEGKQALFLVPEISLTTQLTMRLRKIFGEQLIVYHSKFSDNERVDIWRRLLETSEPLVVLGVRSSVFLPFASLGLVVVDEEHEASYKQNEPAPRYNARDAAIVLAAMHGARTLLGSATPTVETYHKALSGKYGLAELLSRYEEAVLPRVEIVDMRLQRKKHAVTNGLYSDRMMASLRASLAKGRQGIVFQNRRGFAPVVVCEECGWTPKCPDCDVSPIYHRRTDEMRCHYCGRSQRLPKVCPACGQNSVRIFGYGTERIADDLHAMLPDYRIARMDFDTTRAKDSYEEIISEFSARETHLLVGTQMVSKGLDFDNVDIVAVPNADTILNFPDFRSDERAFNMLEQVAGRAGRRNTQGTVIIQTTSPAHEVLSFVSKHDYSGFYNWEIENRRNFGYPPFTRIIQIYLRNKEIDTVSRVAGEYTRRLTGIFGSRVLGPETPHVARVSTFHIRTVMLKVEATASMTKVKALLRKLYVDMADYPGMKSTLLHFDVDPV